MRPLRLYSWHDVSLLLRDQGESLPQNWASIDVSPAGAYIVIGTAPSSEEESHALKGMEIALGSWFDRASRRIRLEAASGQDRGLPVHFEFIPGLTRIGLPPRPLFEDLPKSPSDLPPLADDVPILAFHSYKGGVGRTLSLVTLARTLVSRDIEARRRVRPLLVVDADFEAPGLTWLAQANGRFQEFSFMDALALVHGEGDWRSHALPLICEKAQAETLKLPVNGRITEHFFLPAFRSLEQLLYPPVTPDKLLRPPGRTWVIAELLSALGRELGVSAVLVDCRAGISELSAPFILDPRVRKAIVTSTSTQSVQGTQLVLRELKRRLPSTPDESPCVIVTMTSSDRGLADRVREAMQNTYQEGPDRQTWQQLTLDGLGTDTRLGTVERDLQTETLAVWELPFSPELVHLDDLTDMDRKLTSAGQNDVFNGLAEDLLPTSSGEPVPTTPDFEKPNEDLTKVAAFCRRMEYAENALWGTFLHTLPLKNLARKFATEPPRAIVMGAKGAGKTFTYLQVLRHGNWNAFIEAFGLTSLKCEHRVLPLIRPRHVDEAVSTILGVVTEARTYLNTSSVFGLDEVSTAIQRTVSEGVTDEPYWRDLWIQLMVRMTGVPLKDGDEPLSALQQYLELHDKHLTFVVDGLEDWLPNVHTNAAEQTAIRALCLGVIERLVAIQNRRIGLLVFVRKDLPKAAIRQNFGQFERLYEAFELRWNAAEALRLILWALIHSDVNPKLVEPKIEDLLDGLVFQELDQLLRPVWGLKLGADKGKEAYTTIWVISALSDFHGRMQARDVMRFLHHSSESSRTAGQNPRRPDRLLQIGAVKGAIKPCGQRRVEEMKQEIPALASTLERIQIAPKEARHSPFSWDAFNLTSEEVELLTTQGVVFEEDGKLWTPEIYRQGLDLSLMQGARPRVITLMRRALSASPW